LSFLKDRDHTMMKDDAITLFSFGYWGWGTSTEHLVQAFDALERSRDFGPPVLVDVRISRSVRAPGFNNRALEKLVGVDRYVHMPGLGNLAAIHKADTLTIANPADAESLLDQAIRAHDRRHRIVFFCACPFQLQDGERYCHRYEVGSLLLKESRKRNKQIIVTEWPGTDPEALRLTLPSEVLKKLRGGMKSIPLPKDKPLDRIASITWGSVVHCSGAGEPVHARVDRAMWRPEGWYLPVLDIIGENGAVASRQEVRQRGFLERRT
jgi:hypothetical protein